MSRRIHAPSSAGGRLARALALGAAVTALAALPARPARAQSYEALYTFTGGADGAAPYSKLVNDAQGNLYGTCNMGGLSGDGVVYELSPAGQETVLYTFAGTPDGAASGSGVLLDSQGNLYGTASYGGLIGACSGGAGCGVAFKLTP